MDAARRSAASGWFGIYNLALNAGERHVDAGTAAMIIQIGPVIVAVLAVPLFGERLHGWLLAGMSSASPGSR